MMLIQLFCEAKKRLPILPMGVSMNGDLCTPALAFHSLVERRFGDQIAASVVSIDDHQSCLGRNNRSLADEGYSIPRKSIQCQYIGRRSISWQSNFAILTLVMPNHP
jgi:hypothetical protein